MVSIKFYGKNIEILKFQQPKHSNKNKITDFFPKNHSHFSLNVSKKKKKKKVDKPISMNCDGFYYLSNQRYQILENYLQKHSIKIKNINKQ